MKLILATAVLLPISFWVIGAFWDASNYMCIKNDQTSRLSKPGPIGKSEIQEKLNGQIYQISIDSLQDDMPPFE